MGHETITYLHAQFARKRALLPGLSDQQALLPSDSPVGGGGGVAGRTSQQRKRPIDEQCQAHVVPAAARREVGRGLLATCTGSPAAMAAVVRCHNGGEEPWRRRCHGRGAAAAQ